MDERLNQIDALLKSDPQAAERLAERVLQDTGDAAVEMARALCRWGGVQRVQGRWDAAENAYRDAEVLLNRSSCGAINADSWRRWITSAPCWN